MNHPTCQSQSPVHPAQRQRTAITAGYYAGFIGLGLSMSSLGPTLPKLAEHTGVQLDVISYLFVAKSLGYMTGTVLGGRLYDRWPGHTSMSLALGVMAAALGMAPFVPLVWVLGLVIAVVGIGEGMLDVGGNTLLVWLHHRHVDPFMNALHFFFAVGASMAPVIVARSLAATGDIAAAYLIIAGLLMLPAVWTIRLPAPRRAHVQHTSASRSADPLLIGLIAVFFATFVAGEAAFGGWIYTFALRSGVATEISAGYLNSAFWGALMVGRLIGVPLSARLDARWILWADILGCLVSLAAIMAWRTVPAAVWAGTIGMGLCVAAMFATGINFAERRMPITGAVTSVFLVGGSVGGLLLPWIIGQLFEPMGPMVTMYAIFVDMLLSLGVLVALLAYSRRRHRPQPA